MKLIYEASERLSHLRKLTREHCLD